MKNYSLSRKLKNEGKINSQFESMLSALTLEDVISLKLEIASRNVKGKLYGYPIYQAMPDIAKEAVFKWAVTAADTKTNASRILGISLDKFNKIYKKLNIDNFFQKNT